MGKLPLTEAGSNEQGKQNSIFAASATALSVQLVLQFAIGIGLSRSYTADAAVAHADVAAMHAGGIDRLLQAMHYWGSALLILHGLTHVFGAVWFGFYRRPNGLLFLAGLLFLLTAVGFQMTGNVLPFDRHGVQTAGIEASIAARAPVLGATASHLLLGGDSFSGQTLGIWYGLHRFLLPALSLAALACGYLGLRQSKTRPQLLAAVVPLVVVGIVAAIVPSPLGSAATVADYGAFAAKVSWYVWPMHGAMRAADSAFSGGGWIGAMVLPGLLVLCLAALPVLSNRIPVALARGVCFGLAGVMLLAGAVYGGSFAPLVGTRDPVESSSPSSGQASSPIDKALAEKGRQAFNRLECKSCHGEDGKTGGGGPVLTNAWKKHGDADYYLRYIRNPVGVQSDSTMPAFPSLPDADLKAIAEFLREPKS